MLPNYSPIINRVPQLIFLIKRLIKQYKKGLSVYAKDDLKKRLCNRVGNEMIDFLGKAFNEKVNTETVNVMNENDGRMASFKGKQLLSLIRGGDYVNPGEEEA